MSMQYICKYTCTYIALYMYIYMYIHIYATPIMDLDISERPYIREMSSPAYRIAVIVYLNHTTCYIYIYTFVYIYTYTYQHLHELGMYRRGSMGDMYIP